MGLFDLSRFAHNYLNLRSAVSPLAPHPVENEFKERILFVPGLLEKWGKFETAPAGVISFIF